jgi:hypothetical protein
MRSAAGVDKTNKPASTSRRAFFVRDGGMNTPKAFHTIAQGRSELAEERTLGNATQFECLRQRRYTILLTCRIASTCVTPSV